MTTLKTGTRVPCRYNRSDSTNIIGARLIAGDGVVWLGCPFSSEGEINVDKVDSGKNHADYPPDEADFQAVGPAFAPWTVNEKDGSRAGRTNGIDTKNYAGKYAGKR